MTEKLSYLLNDLMNVKELFRKNVTYGNMKSHKKPGLHRLSIIYMFEKNAMLRVNQDDIALVNNVLRDYNEMKEEINNPKNAVEYII